MTPVSRTVARLVEDGWIAARIDRRTGPVEVDWPANGVGFADVLAVRPGHRPRLIQVTTRSNAAARRSKAQRSRHVIDACTAAGFDVLLETWKVDDVETSALLEAPP